MINSLYYRWYLSTKTTYSHYNVIKTPYFQSILLLLLVLKMKEGKFEVLFLCTGNSARSIMAEAILQRRGLGDFVAYSAGSHPKGKVNPLAIKVLKINHHDIEHLSSKSWDVFGDEIDFDFVITVCRNAANESCPVWPGNPMSAHWGIEDPDQPELSEAEQFELMKKAYWELDYRIKTFTSLPLEKLDQLSLQSQLDKIGSPDRQD